MTDFNQKMIEVGDSTFAVRLKMREEDDPLKLWMKCATLPYSDFQENYTFSTPADDPTVVSASYEMGRGIGLGADNHKSSVLGSNPLLFLRPMKFELTIKPLTYTRWGPAQDSLFNELSRSESTDYYYLGIGLQQQVLNGPFYIYFIWYQRSGYTLTFHTESALIATNSWSNIRITIDESHELKMYVGGYLLVTYQIPFGVYDNYVGSIFSDPNVYNKYYIRNLKISNEI